MAVLNLSVLPICSEMPDFSASSASLPSLSSAARTSRAHTSVFQISLCIEAIESERCGADRTRCAIEVDDVAEAEVEARRSVLHECGEDARDEPP